MSKIWQKGQDEVNKITESYTTGEDYIIDMVIMPYDIVASKAHAQMLQSIGILDKQELEQILLGLDYLQKEYDKGNVKITIQDEDCHTVIEKFLIENIGEAGKKIHTGRSRNDQVLTAVRLYIIDQLKQIQTLNKELILQFISLAKKGKNIVLPGYSHTQQAMLSSVGHWSLSFAESLFNDHDMIQYAININNQNPLGSAAGFGVDFPLDRDMTCDLMGFDKNIVNSLFAQASRGKFESFAMEAMVQVMLTLGRFATDIIFFTTNELNFFHMDESLTTGSSIMPQKKNKDSMELMRGYNSIIMSHQLTVKNLIKSLISGYNRDLQHIKKPIIESVEITKNSILVAIEHVKGISINEEKINQSLQKEIVSADLANKMVEQGIPFREAYIKVGQELDKIDYVDYAEFLNNKKSLGSAGNLNIDYYEKLLEKLL